MDEKKWYLSKGVWGSALVVIVTVLTLLGKKGEAPTIPGNLLADYGSGVHAAFGILSAIIARENTAKGQFIDISLADSVLSLLTHILSWHFASGRVAGQGEHYTTGFYPCYDVYETKDGKYISIGCLEPWFYANLCRTLGIEDLIPYQFAEDEQTREKTRRTFRQIFLTKTRDEWFDILPKNEIAIGKVYSFDELAADPQIQARQMIVELGQPGEKIKQVGISVKLSDTPGQIVNLIPRLGEHTEETLLEIGYTQAQISSLERTGAVQRSSRGEFK